MKRKYLLVLSSALLLGLAACKPPVTNDSSESSSSELSSSSSSVGSSSSSSSVTDVPLSYGISANPENDSRVILHFPESATAGEKVLVTAEYDATLLSIVSIKADDLLLTHEATGYSFEMPEHSVVLRVEVKELPKTYAIALAPESDACVTLTFPETALEGETVGVKATFDASLLKIKAIKANGLTLGRTSENDYFFKMPSENVTLSVETEDLVTAYAIHNGNAEAVDLLGLEGQAEAGKTVTFSYLLHPGYDLAKGVKVLRGGLDSEEEVALSAGTDGKYSFVMPDSEVTILVETTYAVYGFKTVDKEGVIAKVEGADAEHSNAASGYIRYKDTVTVTLKNTDYKKAVGIKVPELYGETVLTPEEGSLTVSFAMPYRSISIQSVSTDYLRPIALTNSEHISLALYTRTSEGSYVQKTENSAVYGETVFVKASISEAKYTLKSLILTYIAEGRSYASTLTVSTSAPNSAGYYSFSMPKADVSKPCTLSVRELDDTKYANAPFVGTYLSAELYSYGTPSTFSRNYGVTIETSGAVTCGSKSYDILSLDEEKKLALLDLDGDGEADGAFAYGERTLVGRYHLGSTEIVSTDMNVAVKKQSASDADSLYAVHWEFIGSDKKLAAVEFTRDGEDYARVFVDLNKKLYFQDDIAFEKQEGTTWVTDKMANYDVKVGGKVLYRIRSSGEGGYQNRHAVDEVYGEYKLAGASEATLVLDGIGGATLKGEKGTYIYKDGQLTVTVGKSTYEITLDLAAMTYVIDSANVYTPANVLDQKSYTGTLTITNYDGDDEDYTVNMSFVDATHVTFEIKQYLVYLGGTTNETRLAEQTYALDEAAKTVTIQYYQNDRSTSLSSLTLAYAEDGSKLTFQENATSVYTTKGLVISLVA